MEIPIVSEPNQDGTVTVTVRGEIDFSNADAVADGIRGAIAELSPPTVWIDLKDATFIDSTGLGALIEGYRAATAGATRFVVVNPTAAFRRVLTVTGLCELFGLAEPVEAAGREVTGA
jgi:anti-sigma B factor antagonist